ncbi:MAG: serine/threonine-protein kinase [Polyangia bacterium]
MQPQAAYPRSFGKYNLLRPLATGGMAEVFLAQMQGSMGFDKACVVKRVLPSHAANALYMQMFLDEAKVIARLSHPNIVQVFDMGQVGDDYFMAMEYVPGADLQDLLDALPTDKRRLPIPVACRIIAQVAEGLEHAHRAVNGDSQLLGIVHRDVSPSNVIISVDGVAKICDFGIAKFGAQVTKTEVGSLKGKIHYMSPEQIRGDKVDGRSDLFALGVVLYEMTVGVRPFEGSNPADIAVKIMNDVPVPPDLIVERYPRELWALVQRLLSKRADDRYASARDVQVALDGLLVGWGVRASSNEVAAYLESTMPGIGARARETSALAARPALPNRRQVDRRGSQQIAVDPTVEVRPFGGGSADLMFGAGVDVAAVGLELGNALDGEELANDRRHDEPRSSGRATYAIVLIVLTVGLGFYWLTRNADREAAVPPTVAAPPTVAPAPVVPPTVETKPIAAPGSEAKPASKPEPRAEPKVEHATEAKPEAKHHTKKPDAAREEPTRALPRLPTPPPTDDTPEAQ